MKRYAFVLFLNALLVTQAADGPGKMLAVPLLETEITVDGRLDEKCYQQPPLTDFVDVANPEAKIGKTKAWVFWSPKALTVAFAVEDASPAAAAATKNENDVDPQDRVELFIWSGKKNDPYYCIEVAALGAVHDYKAKFYRHFDNSWTPKGMQAKVQPTKTGYTVELTLSQGELTLMGFKMEAGARWRAGLFRADFDKLGGTPTWISWVNAQAKEPDFHIAESFGTIELKK